MIGKIIAVYPEGPSSVYNYFCKGDKDLFSFSVDFRCHLDILDAENPLIGRTVEYDDRTDPPMLRFLD
jgi:hypothetical protein